MAFLFRLLCDLLNELDYNRVYKSTTTVQIQRLNVQTVVSWFNKHDLIIPRKGPEAVAFLSCLFPERRPDRVFNLQEKRLESIIQQAQCLGAGRFKDLQSWRTSDGTDFVSCIERVMSATDSEPRPCPSIAVEELDEILDRIAAASAFSSPDLRKRIELLRTNDTLLRVFRIVNSSEAKWVVRMLLKLYSPVCIPEKLAIQQFHFLLPSLLDFQNSFEAAVKLLQGNPINQIPTQVAKEDEVQLREIAISRLLPHIGVMITRPAHEKARGIKHCCQLAG
jgi:DNA ligase 4